MLDDASAILSGANTPTPPKKTSPDIKIVIARTLDDIMRITVIRSSVYMSEQECPYEEEFDGNDFCSTHLLGFVNGEPAACIRIRFFGDFAKLERAAVRQQYRSTRVAFKLIKAAKEHCQRKGFRTVIGHARNELIPLWKMFGFRVPEGGRELMFSDYAYTEMVWESSLPENAITLETDPYVMIRPEGDWDRPGILEDSAERSLADSYSMAAE